MKFFDFNFVYRDCGGDFNKIQRRIDRAIKEAEDYSELELRKRAFDLAHTLLKNQKKKVEFRSGDRVRYYGAFNGDLEVTTATVLKVQKNGLITVQMDWYIENDGRIVKGPCSQTAHPKQLRKLKAKKNA